MEIDPAQISDQTILRGRAIISAARGPQLSSPTWLLRQKSDGIQQKHPALAFSQTGSQRRVFLFGTSVLLDSSCFKMWLRLHRASSAYARYAFVGTLRLADIFKHSGFVKRKNGRALVCARPF